MHIFVGNLSFEAREIDLQRVFMAFGVVTSAAIVMEKKGKKSRGFGFVEMPDEQEAQAAIASLNGREILGRPVNVMPSLSKEPKKQSPGDKDKLGPDFKRTGKYREGRRTFSYMKKRLDAGITAPVAERKYKPNPMRWRKKPRWAGSSQKPEGETKPWQKGEGALKSRRRGAGAAKAWRKSSDDRRRQPNFKKRGSPVSHKK